MWCLVVFQHDLHGQCLPQGKEKLLLKEEEIVYVPLHLTHTESHKTNIMVESPSE